ncbi:MlaD family protein [Parasphingopyxis lamellibrachiae]|uniref:Phospholipid/cholesterol/gamma-HCH transport system substrate-binding protein n=1 Tax=Parasphingopyxis lamellibrachiae TaxID=680125 RepID=A0A3D9FGT1_9SPHN|nr:MlaD family protein [Parasphingopyxis lamellibrachiae]RED16742.1 phospholipid/cholesterol/gamma-HCH transport system substrate-binding protein [Parasphingopyxis lamellibrachiae]
MENRSNQILVGSVVLLLLAALILFTVWLARIGDGSAKSYDIYFSQSVDGLASGSGVTYSGVPVGQIEEISLVPDNPEFVRVRIRVSDDVPVLEGTSATIEGIGFTGVSQISLNGGIQGADPIDELGPGGVPVIPTRPGAFGELLNSAPRLLERLTTLTERLTELLGDRNQNSIAAILENTQRLTAELSAQGPEITATLAESRIAIRQAGVALEQIGELADTTDNLLGTEGEALMRDLRSAVASAESSMQSLDRTITAAEPGLNAFSEQTIPEIGQLVRDLGEMSEAMTAISQRINREGAGSLVGTARLPDYEPQ